MSDGASIPGHALVLVIDDKEVNLRLMRAYLAGEPLQVLTSADPQAALQLVERRPPDLVLLDLMMPVLDGFAVLERLQAIAPQVPVVIITGLEDRDARLRGLAAGARDYLTKPVDRHELLIRVRNLVALKQAGDALARALVQLEAANRDLNAFAGGLAHDLQQPITAITAFATAMQRHRQQLPDDDAAYLVQVVDAAGSARRMIQGLLEFARLGQQALRTAPVDLNVVLQEARGALAHEIEGRGIDWSVGPLPVVSGDRALLLLAFVNLLSNGIKYSRTREQPAIDVELAEPGADGGVAIRFRDNGVGFDMAGADRLFSPFQRLHRASEFEGTGMGLANVRRIMERHGGSVHAQSEPGRGATFTLRFPGAETPGRG